MYGRNKQEHYDRMAQRFDISQGKTGKAQVDFLENMCNEHLAFYTDQGFTEEEALILIKLPDRVRDFFGLRVTVDLYYLYEKGDYDGFFKGVMEFVSQSGKEYRLEDIEFLTEQLAHGLKGMREQTTNSKMQRLLDLDFVSGLVNKIHKKTNKDNNQSKDRIRKKLLELSYLFFRNQEVVSGDRLSQLLGENI